MVEENKFFREMLNQYDPQNFKSTTMRFESNVANIEIISEKTHIDEIQATFLKNTGLNFEALELRN